MHVGHLDQAPVQLLSTDLVKPFADDSDFGDLVELGKVRSRVRLGRVRLHKVR